MQVVDKDHAALKVQNGKVDDSVVFCQKIAPNKWNSGWSSSRTGSAIGFSNQRPTAQHNPRSLDEVKKLAITIPCAITRLEVKEPTAQVRRDLHKCIEPVFINRTADSIALVSLPGSGNTWTRYLIEQSTGILSGSIYGDKRLYQAGLVGENVTTAQVSVVKYHTGAVTSREWFCPEAHTIDGAILLVRDPYYAMMSEFNRKLTGSHTKAASAKVYQMGKARLLTVNGHVRARSSADARANFVFLIQEVKTRYTIPRRSL